MGLCYQYPGGGSTPSYRVNYNKSEKEKLLETPLTFEITSDGTLNFSHEDYSDVQSFTGFTVEYRKNNEEWTQVITTTNETSISVNFGDTVQLRGNNPTYVIRSSDEDEQYVDITFILSTTVSFVVKGNIMSLINSENFSNTTTLQSAYTFNNLFRNCTGLTDANNLVLPATTLARYCYSSMFYDCTSLTTAPELPATTLAQSCYYSMFAECTSLTTAPVLPATTLSESCYSDMFNGCTSLTAAPALPATTLADYCYAGMFAGCTSLTTAPALPVTTLANGCYSGMFNECTSLTTAPELPATILAPYCYQSMFYSCTSLTTAPELPATTLASNCYEQMFASCTSLTTAPSILPATTLAPYCYGTSGGWGMFAGCTSLTTAPELPATTLVNYCYCTMFYGCRNLNYIKCLATNISASNCTRDWVRNVASTGTFVKNPSMTSWTTGIDGIPNGWTVQNA